MNEDRDLNDPKALLIRAKDFGTGSGFFVKKNLIATNIHVVAGATSISAKVVGTDTVYTVEGVTAFDPKNDLVILKIAGEGVPLPIGDSDLLQDEDMVQVVGYPRGKYKVTEGSVHSIRNSDKWIRMKCKTDSGNSGGPVLNVKGKVIGIGVGNSDFYSFAIPVNAVKILLTQTQEIESLAQWKGKEQIRAYTYLVQSQGKHSKPLYRKAIADLDRAIQLYSDYFLFYHNRGVVHRFVGQSKVKKGNIAEAQQHYQDAIIDHTNVIKLCPDCASAYDNRGTAKADFGQSKVKVGDTAVAQQYYQDAIVDYTEAIKLCPDYTLAYINRGTTQSDFGQSKIEMGNVTGAQQHYQDAIVDYAEAIKLNPDCASAYNGRADAKRHFGKSKDTAGNVEAAQQLYQEAIFDINIAIELDSSSPLFHHTRGEIMHALGDYSAAIENYEKSREIDPDYTDVCTDLELAKKALEQQQIL